MVRLECCTEESSMPSKLFRVIVIHSVLYKFTTKVGCTNPQAILKPHGNRACGKAVVAKFRAAPASSLMGLRSEQSSIYH